LSVNSFFAARLDLPLLATVYSLLAATTLEKLPIGVFSATVTTGPMGVLNMSTRGWTGRGRSVVVGFVVGFAEQAPDVSLSHCLACLYLDQLDWLARERIFKTHES